MSQFNECEDHPSNFRCQLQARGCTLGCTRMCSTITIGCILVPRRIMPTQTQGSSPSQRAVLLGRLASVFLNFIPMCRLYKQTVNFIFILLTQLTHIPCLRLDKLLHSSSMSSSNLPQLATERQSSNGQRNSCR